MNIRLVLISGFKFFEKLLMGLSLFVCFKADILSSFPIYLYIPAPKKLPINVKASAKYFYTGVNVDDYTIT